MTNPNFLQFLRNISNPSLVELEENPKYQDLLAAIADMFETVYQFAQDIKITRAYDIIDEGTPINILNLIAEYLDTEHFKDTLAVLMRLWQEKFAPYACKEDREYIKVEDDYVTLYNHKIWLDGEKYIYDPIEFTKNEIIKTFIFFTKNSGQLHKSKGVKALLQRLMEFYGPVNCIDASFTDIKEHQRDDEKNLRFRYMSSLKSAVEEEDLFKNDITKVDFVYRKNPKVDNDERVISKVNWDYLGMGEDELYKLEDIYTQTRKEDFYKLPITQYLEFNKHKICVAGFRVFISEKGRQDWYILSYATEVRKIGDKFIAIFGNGSVRIYQDDMSIYKIEDDRVIHEYDKPTPIEIFGYENDFLNRIEFIPNICNMEDRFGEYFDNKIYYISKLEEEDEINYSLRRIRYDEDYNRIFEDTIIETLSISNDKTLQTETNPKKKLIFIKDLWLKLYEDDAQAFDFNSINPYYDVIFTFVIRYEDFAEVDGRFTNESHHVLCYGRDTHLHNSKEHHWWYTSIAPLDCSLLYKHCLVQRNPNDDLLRELNGLIYNEHSENIEAVLDLIYPQEKFFVGDEGRYSTTYLDHKLLVIQKDIFDYPEEDDEGFEPTIMSDYEKSGGIFQIPLSKIILPISKCCDILDIQFNTIHKFGIDPLVLIFYVSEGKHYIRSLKMDGYYRNHNEFNVELVMKDFPTRGAVFRPYNIDLTDRHIIVFTNYPRINRTIAVVLDNVDHILPLGTQTHDMNPTYDPNIAETMRLSQPDFKRAERISYETESGRKVESIHILKDEKDEGTLEPTFDKLLRRYKPINISTSGMMPIFDIGRMNQLIDEDTRELMDAKKREIQYYYTDELFNDFATLNIQDEFSLIIIEHS